jgi:hypothetical protein
MYPSGPIAAKKSERMLLWLAANLLATAAVAWVGFQIQQEGIAPAILFPLCVGAVSGVAGSAIWHRTGVPSLRWVLFAAAAWGLLVVLAQDYIGHRHRLRLYDEQLSRQANPLVAVVAAQDNAMRPSFVQSLRGVVLGRPVWWSLEVLLTSGAAVAVISLAARRRQLSDALIITDFATALPLRRRTGRAAGSGKSTND